MVRSHLDYCFSVWAPLFYIDFVCVLLVMMCVCRINNKYYIITLLLLPYRKGDIDALEKGPEKSNKNSTRTEKSSF